MAADDTERPNKAEREQGRKTPDELTDLRRQAVRVFLALSVLIVVVDLGGRLLRDPSFHVDSVVFGLVFGTLLALLGLEGINRALGGGSK